MTALDQHIIFQLDSLSEDGKEHARKILGTSKKKKQELITFLIGIYRDIGKDKLNALIKVLQEK